MLISVFFIQRDMRTPISRGLKNFAFSLDNIFLPEMDVNDEGKELNGVAYETLLEFGVLIPYADAFSYEGKGVLVVGNTGIGKTALVRGFKQAYAQKVNILAKDSPVIFKPKDEEPVVYRDRIQSPTKPFLVPFTNPQIDIDEFPLKYMVHLKLGPDNELEKSKRKDSSIEFMVDQKGYYYSAKAHSAVKKIFESVKCYNLFKSNDYDQQWNYVENIKRVLR